MWRLIALFALGSVVGCLQATKYSYANASQTSEFALVSIGDHAGYLIVTGTDQVRTLSSEGGGAE